jgi:hypothetical protein
MANMCINVVTITGPEEEIARFKLTCLRTRKNKRDTVGEKLRGDYEPCIDFVSIHPLDAEELAQVRSGEFNLDSATSYLEIHTDEPGRFKCEFDTRWSPPEAAFEKLSEMFPSLYFEIAGGDDQFNYSFEAKAHAGAFNIQSHALKYFGLCDGGPGNDQRLAHYEPIYKEDLGLYQYEDGKWVWYELQNTAEENIV